MAVRGIPQCWLRNSGQTASDPNTFYAMDIGETIMAAPLITGPSFRNPLRRVQNHIPERRRLFM